MNSVNKILFLFLFLFGLSGCYEATTSSYSGWKSQNSEYKYYAEVRPYSNYKNFQHGYLGASVKSQAAANKTAIDGCAQKYQRSECFVYMEGSNFVWTENVAHIKAKEEKEKKNKELAEQRKKEESLLASINLKRASCTTMGFESETEGMANCVLQLMLQENQGQSTTTISSSDSGMVSAMNDQTRIMEKQLRLQRLENSRYLIRKGNYMMKYGKVPDW